MYYTLDFNKIYSSNFNSALIQDVDQVMENTRQSGKGITDTI